MSYGIMHDATRAYVEQRARQEHRDIAELDLESEASDALSLSIVFGGALDEEFDVGYLLAVNVADMIRDQIERGDAAQEPWEIYLSDGNGDTIYRVESP